MSSGLVDSIMSLLFLPDGTESKLHRHQGYRANSCVSWIRNSKLGWWLCRKLLKKVKIFDGREIRDLMENVVKSNPEIFDGSCFVAAFGKTGKSGDLILYEFLHRVIIEEPKRVKVTDLPKLPQDSKVVFVEDLIGTGRQSLDYITNSLNLFLNRSHIPYLLTVCATPEAIDKVQESSNFKVLTGIILREREYQYYSTANSYFSEAEKTRLKELNDQLKVPGREDYDRGLLISFHYSTPNNSMPILWKDNYTYKNSEHEKKKWFALLPRYF